MARKKKVLKTRIAIVLDRSTSMGQIRKEAVQLFNDQVKAIRKAAKGKAKDTTVSLFTFSDYADEPVIFNAPVSALTEMSVEAYAPNGWTAMYDGIGKAIERLSSLPEMADPDTSFLIITVTDGEENRSRNYTGQRLADKIQILQAGGRWTFTFCGANIDVEKMGQTLNIPRANTMSYQSNSAGTLFASAANSLGTEKFLRSRVSGQSMSRNFYEDPTDPKDTAKVTTTTTVEIPKAKQK
jgi:hypothetical protein